MDWNYLPDCGVGATVGGAKDREKSVKYAKIKRRGSQISVVSTNDVFAMGEGPKKEIRTKART